MNTNAQRPSAFWNYQCFSELSLICRFLNDESVWLCSFLHNKSKIVWPQPGFKTAPGQTSLDVQFGALKSVPVLQRRKKWLLSVPFCSVEPALHRRERELGDKNHRLWLRSPQTTRQSAPEDPLFHAAVRSTGDTEVRRLRRVVRPVESGGHSGEWVWDRMKHHNATFNLLVH